VSTGWVAALLSGCYERSFYAHFVSLLLFFSLFLPASFLAGHVQILTDVVLQRPSKFARVQSKKRWIPCPDEQHGCWYSTGDRLPSWVSSRQWIGPRKLQPLRTVWMLSIICFSQMQMPCQMHMLSVMNIHRGTYSVDPFEGCIGDCGVRLCNECPEVSSIPTQSHPDRSSTPDLHLWLITLKIYISQSYELLVNKKTRGWQGAVCSGGLDEDVDNHFQPLSGTWLQESTTLSTGAVMIRFRLSECEEGFKLIRGQINAYTRDKCEECAFGKLALGQAIYAPEHSSRIQECLECQDLTGVLCKGGALGMFYMSRECLKFFFLVSRDV